MLETHTNVSGSAQLHITLELSYWFVSDPFPLVDGRVPRDVEKPIPLWGWVGGFPQRLSRFPEKVKKAKHHQSPVQMSSQ